MITEIKDLERKIERDRKIINRLLIGLLALFLGYVATMIVTIHMLF